MKTEMKLAGLFGVSGLWIIFLGLSFESWPGLLQWLLQASLFWFYVWWETWRRRNLNRVNSSEPLLANLGWANRLTLLRGYLIALTGGFLFQSQPLGFMAWIPGLVYGAAAVLDRLDGFIARKNNRTTLLGAELDTVFDAMGLIIAPLLAIAYGKVHWCYLLLSVAYYIFQWGIRWRQRRRLPIYDLMPSQLRRTLAGFQMGFIALALLPCFQVPQTLTCSFAFVLPVLLGFIVDWLVVSGRIKIQTIQDFFIDLANFSTGIFQPVLRAFVAIGLFYLACQLDLSLTFAAPNFLLSLGLLFGASLLLSGWAGRVGALVILLLLCSYSIPINIFTIAILSSTVWLLLLGTGRFSLWQWDDVWVNRQDGA